MSYDPVLSSRVPQSLTDAARAAVGYPVASSELIRLGLEALAETASSRPPEGRAGTPAGFRVPQPSKRTTPARRTSL